MVTQNVVFVLDSNRKQLDPCRPARARLLLKEHKAVIFRTYPFTIILKESKPDAIVKPLTVKIDPGSKFTGLVITDPKAARVIFAAELEHRGSLISKRLAVRSAIRRNRRNRKTRYRQARFLNRVKSKPEGWLAPSLNHRVYTTETWVNKFRKFSNISSISVERVKFDMQLMRNPEISGIEYQQGELQGYNVREYLLEKYNRKCAYCSRENLPLQIEHIIPKAKGGSNAVNNLTLACKDCNIDKGSRSIEEFLKNKPDLLKKINSQRLKPLKDAAAVNATRNKLLATLIKTDLPIETGTGAQTKFNRSTQSYPKAHWIDAACVGNSGSEVSLDPLMKPLKIKCMGHGNRRMCKINEFGNPIGHRKRVNNYFGFKTGDLVKAKIIKGKKIGTYKGRVSCRETGRFGINGQVDGISYKCFTKIQNKDGY